MGAAPPLESHTSGAALGCSTPEDAGSTHGKGVSPSEGLWEEASGWAWPASETVDAAGPAEAARGLRRRGLLLAEEGVGSGRRVWPIALSG